MSKALFKIPRKIDPNAAPYWDLVRKHGTSRKSMVDFITGIGGYSNHGERFAVEFNCKAYHFDLTFDRFWELAQTDHWEKDVAYDQSTKDLCLKVYGEHEDALFSWGLEDAGRYWQDNDHSENFTGKRIPTDWEFHGRGGGHLCMSDCAGINLCQSPENLAQDLLETDDYFPFPYTVDIERIQDLFIACVQATVEITPQKASREVEHHAAFRLWQCCLFAIDDAKQTTEEFERIKSKGTLVRDYLADSKCDGAVMSSFDALYKIALSTVGR